MYQFVISTSDKYWYSERVIQGMFIVHKNKFIPNNLRGPSQSEDMEEKLTTNY